MTDVVIIGGGLIGMMTAHYLAQKGRKVALFDRGMTGSESSWAGGGILSPLYPWRYPQAVTDLAKVSQAQYAELAEMLRVTTGIDPEWRQSGLMMLKLDVDECQQAAKWAKQNGYALELVDRAGVDRLQPGIGINSAEAVWMPNIAQIRNPRLLKALRRLLEVDGVEVFEGHEVTDILVENGRVVGVRVGESPHLAGQVVVAGGAWSGRIMATLGIELPVRPVKGQMLLYRAPQGLLEHIILSEDHYLIPRADGRVLVGSTLEHCGFDKQTTTGALEELRRYAQRILPVLDAYPIERQWAGLRPGTVDGIPFIGPCPEIDGLYVNAGHYRNGVVTGLASVELLVDIMLQQSPALIAEPYSLLHACKAAGDS
jgi:glycine oxidase